jgi:hypothetical protein
MIVNNAGGKDFAPDPLLDFDTAYDARVVGITTIGTHEKGVWCTKTKKFKDGEFKEVAQAIVQFEFTEPETMLTRGEGEDEHQVPRTTLSFIKYDSHEKGGFYKMAKAANPKSVSIVNKKGVVDTSLIIGEAVSIKMKADPKDDNKMYIDEITAIAAKYKKLVEPMTLTPFQYDVESGSHPLSDGTKTTIDAVPSWMLNYAITTAIDAENFKMVDEIEAYIEKCDAEKDGNTELEGDKLEDAKSEKKEAKAPSRRELKKAEEAEAAALLLEEEQAAEAAAKLVEEEEPTEKPKTSRRGRGKAKSASKHTQESLDAIEEVEGLEDLLVKEVGDEVKSESMLDDIDAAAKDDEDYREQLTAAILAL